MKKALSVVAFWFSFQFLLSVGLVGCNPCGSFEPENYHLTGINASVQRIDSIKKQYYNEVILLKSFDGPIEARYDSIGIKSDNLLQLAMDHSQKEFYAGFQSAFACSPPGPNYLDKLADIIITSNKDYNSEYQAGQNLAGMLQVSREHIEQRYAAEGMDVSDYLKLGNSLRMDGLLFTFRKAPGANNVHDLTVKYVLENGVSYESSIQNVLIKKD